MNAVLERGRVIRIDEDGRAVVESVDSPGVITLPMRSAVPVSEWDNVLFCEFADGQGVILALM